MSCYPAWMAPARSRFVRLPFEPRPRMGVATLSVLVAAAASAGIVLLIAGLGSTGSLVETLRSPGGLKALVLLATAGGVVALFVVINHRRLRRVLGMIGTRPPAEVLAAALEAPLWLGDPAVVVRAVARELLARRQACGQAFAALRPVEAAAIRPIEAGFEPVPLDETDERFEELRAAHETDPPRRCETLGRRRVRRWILRLLPIAFMLPGLAVMAAAGAWRFVGVLAVVLVSVAAMIYVLSQFEPAGGQSQDGWRLVPGGVLGLRAAGRAWHLTLLTARDAILIAWPETPARRRWRVAVASREDWLTRRATPMELRMLLSAWLSPLEPPAAQQLSDFAAR